MKIAVVDIGTNSTRLLIAELQDGRVVAEPERHSKVTRLGQGVDARGRLADEAMQRVYDTLEQFRGSIDRELPDRAVAVLTSAVRDAANGREFADTVRDRYGLEPHILSGDQEAEFTFLGATSERDPDDQTATVVVDIGGGSTELVVGAAQQISFHMSTQAGVVRQSERHLHGDPPTPQEMAALSEDVRAILRAGVPEEHRVAQRGIAVAGTATQLAAISQELEPYNADKVHGFVLDTAEVGRLRDRLAALPLAEREHVRGLDPGRAPTIVAGALILDQAMELFGLDAIEVSEHDILRGAALGL
jgi:exopolyphosphatase / guanosine-5'-triphosphate,3'-diphosphate pyrophosphatase